MENRGAPAPGRTETSPHRPPGWHRTPPSRAATVRTRWWLTRAAVSALAGLALTVAGAAAGLLPLAAAHIDLVSASPADGSRALKAPEQIKLQFSDDIEPRFAKLALMVSGTSQALTSRVDGSQVVATLPRISSSNEEWKVNYRVVSTDGHPVTGTIRFAVSAASSSASTLSASSRPSSSAPKATPPSPSAVQTPTPATPSVAQSLDPQTGLPATDTHARRPGGWILFALGAAFLVLAPIGVAMGGIARPKSHEPTPTDGSVDQPTPEDPGAAEEPAATVEGPRDDR